MNSKVNPGAEDAHGEDARAQALVEAVCARFRAAGETLAAEFARQFYALAAPEDLAERSVDDLCGALRSQLQVAAEFAGGAPKLQVFNPNVAEHGWHSPHTVVQIVNDDMPFLVDSITIEINRQGLTVHWLVHPVLGVRRDAEHRLLAIDERDADGRFESFIHIEVERCAEAAQLNALLDGLNAVLDDVRAAVEDWKAMKHRIIDILAEAESAPASAITDYAEGCDFLRWVADENFTLLGCRDYDLVSDPVQGDQLRAVPGSGLGVLRERGEAAPSISFAQMPAEMRAYAREPNLLTLTKANARATVHRAGYLDYIGVKRFDEHANVIGERRVLGLYTSIAYSTSPTQIPLLRSKVAAVKRRAGFRIQSHAAKNLSAILDRYPRDQLLQISADELYRHAIGILRLGERQRTRLFVRRDAFGRFYTSLLFVPRDVYEPALGERVHAMLREAFSATSSEFSVRMADSALARLLIVVRTPQGVVPAADEDELERRIVHMIRSWSDELRTALVAAHGDERALTLFARYAGGFDAGYREDHGPQAAARDVELLDGIASVDDIAMDLYRPRAAASGQLRFKLYVRGRPAPLSDTLPMLENMGARVLDERPYELRRADGETFWINDFGLQTSLPDDFDLEQARARFHESFRRTWRGDTDNDAFNRLVLLAGLDWRAVMMLRAYARYMKQATFPFSQSYIENALSANAAITTALAGLFELRFDPARAASAAECSAAVAAIEAALENVANLDEDRVLRHYLALIQATLRTNYHQRDVAGEVKSWLALKFDPARVPLLPQPRPMFEIFVFSPRVEGVHLRGGKVARGGLRWSDRMEDFRTEVLGLVKAQQVKNVVIVPVGSKGCFVVRQPPADREAAQAEGVACYQIYLRGMLDVTDNLVGGAVVPPPQTVRHDGDDPYLVVAADKGTARFSDIANRTAAEYDFWLGDAFASGGSAGYDHKGMAITARGAWESAKHHFRALNHDIQSKDFTVAGVGDMSGDVFGNGMLRSRHIRLIAAFDHRHVFIDPDPDAARSYAERERLFRLPRSSWENYDAALISPGGGVFARSAKSVTLSPQARAALGIDVERLSPNELVQAVLAAPVDMFYNGGIGTYVKASTESHREVGDRANDSTRIDALALRCKVAVEGGNLGFTQRARIEFAARGGRINTDAIDNSGGVDCSDHEVNIKIVLNAALARGEFSRPQRDELLRDMTDAVAELVLSCNRAQNRILAREGERAPASVEVHARFLRHLVSSGRLDRALEFLPDDDSIAARELAHGGLLVPELAVVMAYSKIELYESVLASTVPDDSFVADVLEHYFPPQLRARHGGGIAQHPLRREIIATQVVNDLVNRVGPTFAFRLYEESGASLPDIVCAYLAAREIFAVRALWELIGALDGQISLSVQHALLQAVEQLLARAVVWLLQRAELLDALAATVERFAPGARALEADLGQWLSSAESAVLDERAQAWSAHGVPAALARQIAQLDALDSALDIVDVAAAQNRKVDCVASVYFGLGGRLELGWLQQHINELVVDGQWADRARIALRDELSGLARDLAAAVLAQDPDCDASALIAAWEERRASQLQRYQQLLAELRTSAALDLAMLAVAVRAARALV